MIYVLGCWLQDTHMCSGKWQVIITNSHNRENKTEKYWNYPLASLNAWPSFFANWLVLQRCYFVICRDQDNKF